MLRLYKGELRSETIMAIFKGACRKCDWESIEYSKYQDAHDVSLMHAKENDHEVSIMQKGEDISPFQIEIVEI